jgi:hypothetical protein
MLALDEADEFSHRLLVEDQAGAGDTVDLRKRADVAERDRAPVVAHGALPVVQAVAPDLQAAT